MIFRRRFSVVADEPRGLIGGLMERVVTKIRGDQPLAGQVQAKLDEARARRDALEAQVGELSLDALVDDGPAEERRKQLVRDLTEVREECDRLEEALAAAVERDATRAALWSWRAGKINWRPSSVPWRPARRRRPTSTTSRSRLSTPGGV